jgi:hypothetical protein
MDPLVLVMLTFKVCCAAAPLAWMVPNEISAFVMRNSLNWANPREGRVETRQMMSFIFTRESQTDVRDWSIYLYGMGAVAARFLNVLRVTKMLRFIQLEKFAYSAHILLFDGVWKRANAFPPEQSA